MFVCVCLGVCLGMCVYVCQSVGVCLGVCVYTSGMGGRGGGHGGLTDLSSGYEVMQISFLTNKIHHDN